MLDELYSMPWAVERVRRSWLKRVLDGYLHKLAAQRYRTSTILTYATHLLRFGEFVEQQGPCDILELPRWVEPFLSQSPSRNGRTRARRSALTCFLRHLVQEGLLLVGEPAPPTHPHKELIEGYTTFLRDQRGLAMATLRYVRRICQTLMADLNAERVTDLAALEPQAIHRFLTRQGERYRRKSLQLTCSVLRGYLSYLYRRGVVSIDLSSAVVAPRVFQHESCPQFLTRSEIEAVLAVIDRQTPQGRRDYAMLLLLSTYGLRASEVLRLRLGDIDWRNQMLHIRGRKAGNNSRYPLARPAGEAILSYLRGGRPESAHRQIFLSTLAPFPPLGSTALAPVVNKYLARAGIRAGRSGTHIFRYSCAQRLFEEGLSLKSIGDFLGHSHAASTQRYTKIDLDRLRDVASGDGEDLL